MIQQRTREGPSVLLDHQLLSRGLELSSEVEKACNCLTKDGSSARLQILYDGGDPIGEQRMLNLVVILAQQCWESKCAAPYFSSVLSHTCSHKNNKLFTKTTLLHWIYLVFAMCCSLTYLPLPAARLAHAAGAPSTQRSLNSMCQAHPLYDHSRA